MLDYMCIINFHIIIVIIVISFGMGSSAEAM